MQMPDLSGLKPGSLRLILYHVTGRTPGDYRVYALVVNLVRIVDLAVQDYESCRTWLSRFWHREDNSTVPLGFLVLGAGHFEECITNLKRAIDFLKALQAYDGLRPSTLALVRRRYGVLKDRVQHAVTGMRDAIQHLMKDIGHGAIVEGQAIFPSSSDKKGMRLGQHEVLFSDLAAWLTELHTLAETITLDWQRCYDEAL